MGCSITLSESSDELSLILCEEGFGLMSSSCIKDSLNAKSAKGAMLGCSKGAWGSGSTMPG